MKTRNGHVSNSSSTSFILVLSRDDYEELSKGDEEWQSLLGDESSCQINGKEALMVKGSEYLGGRELESLEKVLKERFEGRYFFETHEANSSGEWQ